MARVTARGIELKCRRCKRVLVVDTTHAGRTWATVHLQDEVGEMP